MNRNERPERKRVKGSKTQRETDRLDRDKETEGRPKLEKPRKRERVKRLRPGKLELEDSGRQGGHARDPGSERKPRRGQRCGKLRD
jgi:hypothetical protein